MSFYSEDKINYNEEESIEKKENKNPNFIQEKKAKKEDAVSKSIRVTNFVEKPILSRIEERIPKKKKVIKRSNSCLIEKSNCRSVNKNHYF